MSGKSTYQHRNLRFGMAVLLGVELYTKEIAPLHPNAMYIKRLWYIRLPDDKMSAHKGYVTGSFKYRYRAVESALSQMGID